LISVQISAWGDLAEESAKAAEPKGTVDYEVTRFSHQHIKI
jgi:hypothetical protein